VGDFDILFCFFFEESALPALPGGGDDAGGPQQ